MKSLVTRWPLLVIAGTLLSGCGQASVDVTPADDPITITEIGDSDRHRLQLSDLAATRLGVETAAISGGPGGALLIPYAAILYDAAGATWTYVNSERLVYVREPIEVEAIEGSVARLTSGPSTGTLVVTVGAAELWGAETGVGGGH
ncbi:MAG: hypothetical protein ACR2K4_08915 [Candidatus Limnocylindria bacterium]